MADGKSGFIGFRADPQLTSALAALSDKSGVTVSEIVRGAVEDHLSTVDVPDKAPASLNPFAKLAAASRGSLKAQRELAEQALALAMEAETDEHRSLLIHDALTFARLAAAQGYLQDQGMVISLLAVQAELLGEDGVEMAEAIARVSLLADLGGEGGELAARYLPQIADGVAPGVMQSAQRFRELMTSGDLPHPPSSEGE